MTLLAYLRTRALLWQARHHAETGRWLWLLSEHHNRRAGIYLDRLEAGTPADRQR